MWSKALTWKRDKAREEQISKRNAIEISKRCEIISALKMAEQSAATTIAQQLIEYYQENKRIFHDLDVENGVFKSQADGEGLFKSGDESTGVYLLIIEDKVEFYARYTAISDQRLPDIIIQKVDFYRLGDSIYTVNISKCILFDCLLPSYKVIATNPHLTLYEKKIWVHAVGFALDHPEKYSVFVLDTQRDEQTAIQITTKDQPLINKDWLTEIDFTIQTIVITRS